MTNWTRMRLLLVALVWTLSAAAQNIDDFAIYTEHPRLLLNTRHLRLLVRERERQSLRWMQFDTLMRGKVQMPEPAFANSLYGRVTGDAAWAKAAAEAALKPTADLRSVALAWDWCESSLTDAQKAQLKARLDKALRDPITSFAAARDHVFAAVTVENAAALQDVVVRWWRGETAPALKSGALTLGHADLYPFMEMAHVLRDNFQIDIRDDIPPVFKDLAHTRLLSYYPASFPAPENEFRIPYTENPKGEPDTRLASLTRAGEFALVAFESNAQEMQFLQGWLLNDRFALKSPFGAPYEFLWANPYQPGLPFEKMPPFLHDTRNGRLLVRSSWEEDADWIGVGKGFTQAFRAGQVRPLALKEAVAIGEVNILPGAVDRRQFRVGKTGPAHWCLVGLKPDTVFDVEIDDEELDEGRSDRGGILELDFTRQDEQGVSVHESHVAAVN